MLLHPIPLPTRKVNPPNMVSHITQRAAGKEPLFLENDDSIYSC